MNIEELITRLRTMDPKTQVMFDVTAPGSEILHLIGVRDVHGLELESGEIFIVLSCDVQENYIHPN